MTAIAENLWQRTNKLAFEGRRVDRNIETDVCIIGGGYTGLSTAVHLAEAGVSCAVLEARTIGFGASGRNAGHCTPTFHHHSLDGIIRILGPRFGPRFIRAQLDSANVVFGIIRRYAIDCGAVQNGYLEVAHTPSQLDTLSAKCARYSSFGKNTRIVGKDEAAHLSGSPRYFGAWLHPEGGHLNPLSYALGLARAAIESGASVHTETPVLSIEKASGKWRVLTTGGAVTAQKVVVATGAYPSGPFRGLDRQFAKLTTLAIATQQYPETLLAELIPDNNTIVETRSDPATYRRTSDNRLVSTIIVEGRRGADIAFTESLLSKRFAWILPRLDPIRIEYYWSGDLDVVPRSFPKLVELDSGCLAVFGYSGRGVPTGTALGPIVAEWAKGTPVAELALPIDAPRPRSRLLQPALRLALPLSRMRDQISAWRHGIRPPRY